MRFLLLAMLVASCQAGVPADRVSTAPVDPVRLAPSPAVGAGATIRFGDRTVAVDVADTADSRRIGLSGRPSLAPDTGLVLAWPKPTPVTIWMPDMNFAIDVIFVRAGQVVAVYADAQPCPKNGPCPTFGPETPVDYVLEVPAGSAARWGLKAGDAIALTGKDLASAEAEEEL